MKDIKSVSFTTDSKIANAIQKWLDNNNKKFYFISIFLCLIFSVLLFNVKISEANDDSTYIESGYKYVTEFPKFFHTFNAPLYPMVLALIIKLFGFHLILFKCFSVIFNLLGLILLYKTLNNRIPALIFIPVILFHAINHQMLYYASMTFSEAFYIFLQSLMVFSFVKLYDKINNDGVELKNQFLNWLFFGFTLLLLSTARSVGIIALPVAIMFFLIDKKYKAILFTILSYGVFKLIYELLVTSIWNVPNQFKGQAKALMQKDLYNPSKGMEDFGGFVTRFIENTSQYLGKRFYQIIGWRNENVPINPNEFGEMPSQFSIYGVSGFFTLILVIIGVWYIYKKANKSVFFISFFCLAQTIFSFIILQARWDQVRLILVCMPVLILILFYLLLQLSLKFNKKLEVLTVILLLVTISFSFSTIKRSLKNLPIVSKNLKGDNYFGYSPDWVNFLKCSEWCANNLPQNSLVASRKAPMSFIYGKGKKFFPIYSVIKRDTLTNQSNPDSALVFFRTNNVTHVMIGQLRIDPNNPAAGFINTMHNILAPIAQKYPNKLKLVHTEGAFEESQVFEIIY